MNYTTKQQVREAAHREVWEERMQDVPHFEELLHHELNHLDLETIKRYIRKFLGQENVDNSWKSTNKKAFFKVLNISSQSELLEIQEQIERAYQRKCSQIKSPQMIRDKNALIKEQWVEPKFFSLRKSTLLQHKTEFSFADFMKQLLFPGTEVVFVQAHVGKTFLLEYLLSQGENVQQNRNACLMWNHDSDDLQDKELILVDSDRRKDCKKLIQCCRDNFGVRILVVVDEDECLNDIIDELQLGYTAEDLLQVTKPGIHVEHNEFQFYRMEIDLTLEDMQKLIAIEIDQAKNRKNLRDLETFLHNTKLKVPSLFRDMRFWRTTLKMLRVINEKIEWKKDDWANLIAETFCQHMAMILPEEVQYKKTKMQVFLSSFCCAWIKESVCESNTHPTYSNSILIDPTQLFVEELWQKIAILKDSVDRNSLSWDEAVNHAIISKNISPQTFTRQFLAFPLWKIEEKDLLLTGSSIEEENMLTKVLRHFLDDVSKLGEQTQQLLYHLNDRLVDFVHIIQSMIQDARLAKMVKKEMKTPDLPHKDLLGLILATGHEDIKELPQHWQNCVSQISKLVNALQDIRKNKENAKSNFGKVLNKKRRILEYISLLMTRYKPTFQHVCRKYQDKLPYIEICEQHLDNEYTPVVEKLHTLCYFPFAKAKIGDRLYERYLRDNFDDWIETLEWLAIEKQNKHAIVIFEKHLEKWLRERWSHNKLPDIQNYEWFPAICVCDWEEKKFAKWYKKRSRPQKEDFFKQLIRESTFLCDIENLPQVWEIVTKVSNKPFVEECVQEVLCTHDDDNGFFWQCISRYKGDIIFTKDHQMQVDRRYEKLPKLLDLLYQNCLEIYVRFIDVLFHYECNNDLPSLHIKKVALDHYAKNYQRSTFADHFLPWILDLQSRFNSKFKDVTCENYFRYSFPVPLPYTGKKHNVLAWGVEIICEKVGKTSARKKKWKTAEKIWTECKDTEKIHPFVVRNINRKLLQVQEMRNKEKGEKVDIADYMIEYLSHDTSPMNFVNVCLQNLSPHDKEMQFYLFFIAKLREEKKEVYSQWTSSLSESEHQQILVRAKDESFLDNLLLQNLDFVYQYANAEQKWFDWLFSHIDNREDNSELWQRIFAKIQHHSGIENLVENIVRHHMQMKPAKQKKRLLEALSQFHIAGIYNKYILQWLIDVMTKQGVDSDLAQLFTSWKITSSNRLSLNEKDVEFLKSNIANFVEKRLGKLMWCTENHGVLNFLLFLLAEFAEQWSSKEKKVLNDWALEQMEHIEDQVTRIDSQINYPLLFIDNILRTLPIEEETATEMYDVFFDAVYRMFNCSVRHIITLQSLLEYVDVENVLLDEHIKKLERRYKSKKEIFVLHLLWCVYFPKRTKGFSKLLPHTNLIKNLRQSQVGCSSLEEILSPMLEDNSNSRDLLQQYFAKHITYEELVFLLKILVNDFAVFHDIELEQFIKQNEVKIDERQASLPVNFVSACRLLGHQNWVDIAQFRIKANSKERQLWRHFLLCLYTDHPQYRNVVIGLKAQFCRE